MNDATLLEYGLRELPAFRADMRAIAGIDGGSRRYVAARLRDHPAVSSYVVEAENFESIHNHSAYARIASSVER